MGLNDAPPEHVELWGDRSAEGIDFGFIPQGLQVRTGRSLGLCGGKLRMFFLTRVIANMVIS
jgi:hypothetical protein